MSTALLFPGQGSQSLGMLAELESSCPVVGQTFAEASDRLGYDLWRVVANGPEAQLNQTRTTQPALLAAGIATWRVWQQFDGPKPDHVAGHSLGEYTALVAAGSLDFGDAIALVETRGRLMQEATPAGTGAMAAILGLDDEVLESVCAEAAAGEVVSCANFNSPGQVVIAGHAGAVERACEAAKAAGARRALPLAVSVPSHCALMKPAAEKLEAVLADVAIEPPAIPVIHNVDVASHAEPAAIRQALTRQLWQPVRWASTIAWLADSGMSHCAECGPGKVLAGLNRRISRDINSSALVDPASIESTIANWNER